ncbi:acyltransferase [Pedobacter psychrodurus]|uniref:Acyltransferase n=1 Tax=Pedobacter psychrodurus TaxID=2530456 RepID=A0A4V2MQQ6_9SPHI|nr:acyltransferase [Pedobacter psychrodurus]TCD25564.1 acyltransferase [Pedobacter psychrodurus]
MANQSSRNVWVDYLRSTVTVLVVAHHAALAYTTFSVFNTDAYILSTHPVVDRSRWALLDGVVSFNDTFFMSLMFFLGGLFFFSSINKKGSLSFIKDKVFRLLIPFLLLGTMLMLLAYFPSFYLMSGSTNIWVYIRDFFTTEAWPVGPPWFLWLLFVFNLVAALFHQLINGRKNFFLELNLNKSTKAFSLFLILFLIGLLAYLPMAGYFGPYSWTGIGPFDFQLSRLVLYFAYFGIGAVVGKLAISEGVFAEDSSPVKHYRLWCLLAIIAFISFLFLPDLLKEVLGQKLMVNQIAIVNNTLFVLCCTLTSIAFLTTFSKLVVKKITWWDSLSKHAYLIYLVHFVYITWFQFLLLNFNIGAGFKFLIVFILSLALSWGTAYLLRKIPLVNKYL